MIGVAGGLVAAVLWGASGFTAARSSRMLGAREALAWVYVVGLVVVVPVAAATGAPHANGRAIAWTIAADAGAVSSLYLMYAALKRGPIAIVMPVTAMQGALAAVVAVAAGERLRPVAWVGLAIAVLGMVAVMWRPVEAAPVATAAFVLAALSAATAALALFASPRAAHSLGTPWLLATLRTAGVLAIAGPLAVRRRLPLPHAATRFVLFSGCADAAAFGSYIAAAARSGVAVPAVLSSQYAAVSAIFGVVALQERLTRPQLAGVLGILGGVAVVTAVQA